ncbi:hypothetical protein AVEN_213007-1 [Araneus ventricosus]|uniref:Uncharacterized protein n=1 Tax=Araneus ventricosus TaxID=182803 RepID=A0A4Y2JVW2_ARAVE|nr:hypothetical protein AVEN_213007-1 [Araneus ventricosus]
MLDSKLDVVSWTIYTPNTTLANRMALSQSLPMEPYNDVVETVTSNLDRLEMFFGTNNVPHDKKVPTTITLLLVKTYTLLKNLVEPRKAKG